MSRKSGGTGRATIDIFIRTTFLIILAFSLLNGLVNLFLYVHSRRALYLKTALFWGALIINFLVQARAQGTELEIILSYGFTVIPLNLLAYASLSFCDAKYPGRVFVPLSLGAGALTLVMAPLDVGFTARAMPLAVVAALPLVHTIYCFMTAPKRGLTPLMGAHAFVLFLLAVHSLNFALFRMEPSAQLWGWPVVYGLYQIMAMLFPALAMDFNHLEEKERLRDVIAARTAELTRANEHLNHLVQHKDFLTKTLTHDISNPLSVIQGKLALAARGIKDEAKFVGDLSRMAERIDGLIRQVRGFEVAGQRIAAAGLSDLRVIDAVRSMQDLFGERLAAKNLTLKFDEARLTTATIRVESSSFLSSVLPNVISNAIKFSHRDGEIRVAIEARGPSDVALVVEDDGVGISPEIIPRMFTFGLNASRVGTGGETGTGFGMPILAQLVNSYGGEVRVESRVEVPGASGSTKFELRLAGAFDAAPRAA